MSNNGYSNVMACGACAVSMNESGEVVTSIDLFVNGVKRLLAGRGFFSKKSTTSSR